MRRHWRGIGVTLFVNWAVKPFSMAFFMWLFIGHVFRCMAAGRPVRFVRRRPDPAGRCAPPPWCSSGAICRGEPHFTLSQVALNDTIMVFAFAPIVGLLLGLSSITVPWQTLLLSVLLYIVVPVAIAQAAAPSPAGRRRPRAGCRPPAAGPSPGGALLRDPGAVFGFQGAQILASRW